jgi:hypothetical protein
MALPQPLLTRDSGRKFYFEGGFHCASFPQIGTGIQLTPYPFRAIVSRSTMRPLECLVTTSITIGEFRFAVSRGG